MLICDLFFFNLKVTLSWILDDILREMDFNERIVMDYEGNILVTSIFVGNCWILILVDFR